MGAACLLAEGEHDADADRRNQQAAGQPSPPLAKREVEGHQGKTGRGMGTRKAMARRLAERSVGQQRGVCPVPAVVRKVARAVHARHLLEPADDRGGEDHGEHHVTCAQPQSAQPRDEEACGPGGERGESRHPDEHGTARVNQVYRPPRVCADPGARGPVEEEGIGDAPVEVEGSERRERSDQDGGGQPGMQQPEPCRVHGQKLRLV